MAANTDRYIDEINNLTSYIVQGPLMTDQIIATINEFYSEKPTKYADRNIVLKTALVFSEDGAFGLGRMFEMLAEMEEIPEQFMSFRSADDAYKWLSATWDGEKSIKDKQAFSYQSNFHFIL